MIELTGMDGKPVWVNPRFVAYVEHRPDCKEDRANACVHVASGGEGICLWVQETPKQVLRRMP